MSTTFKTGRNDTFESIARKAYGDERFAGQVQRANPGITEPIPEGTDLVVTPSPGSGGDAPQGSTAPNNPTETAVTVDGKRFRFWTRIRIVRSIDTVDIAEFSGPFESTAEDLRESFKPFQYQPLRVRVGDQDLFTGTMIGVKPTMTSESKTVGVSGYALPGVLSDCTAPASMFPLEWNDSKLDAIASALAEPFGLRVDFRDDPGPVFERVALDPGERIFTFLTELAQQRGLIISSSETGDLIFWKSVSGGRPVAKLEQGQSPLMSIQPFFSPQEYYSHITGVAPTMIGVEGSQFTVKNPRLSGILRPFIFALPDTLESDAEEPVQTKQGRMFANAVSYEMTVATWLDSSGELWRPNTVVSVHAPGAMIYEPYSFIIRSVEFNKDSGGETAIINLVLPGSFSGETPESMPWD